MDQSCVEAAGKLVTASYLQQAWEALAGTSRLYRELIEKRKLPETGWTDQQVEALLSDISRLDTNNFSSHCGAGEREGRIFSSLVARRHHYMVHGVGRSGDVTAVQPKAVGSSLIATLTNALLSALFKLAGLRTACHTLLLPLATGMSLSLVLQTLRHHRPTAKYVLWFRCDQKSCMKAVRAAGFELVPMELTLQGDELRGIVETVEEAVQLLGADNVVAVVTTTSCFAPRGADDVASVATYCAAATLPHIINNAYGLQSTKLTHIIEEACCQGRVDAVVQSTDKNLLVPVGGAVVSSPKKEFVAQLAAAYPGRASFSPTLDVFITLLQLGSCGWLEAVRDRRRVHGLLRQRLSELASRRGELVLDTPHNPISVALSLESLQRDQVGIVGSRLFRSGVTGVRVVSGLDSVTVCGREYTGWGTSAPSYRCAYVTVAAGIGMSEAEVDTVVRKLEQVVVKTGRLADKVVAQV